MNKQPSDDCREREVAAVMNGPDRRDPPYVGKVVELPIIFVAALSAAGTTVEAFIARLTNRSIRQDDAILCADRKIVIQAYLAHNGLRSVVQISYRRCHAVDSAQGLRG